MRHAPPADLFAMERRNQDDPVLRALADWLGARVTVQVSPERFTFTHRDQTVELGTFVCVEKKGDQLQILGIGEPAPGAIRVNLFEESDASAPAINRMECLSQLCRHGLAQVLGRGLAFRPAIVVEGSLSLDPVLRGYQQTLLEEALLEAGGRIVHFEDAKAA